VQQSLMNRQSNLARYTSASLLGVARTAANFVDDAAKNWSKSKSFVPRGAVWQ
jgi:hypothetical protein